MFLCVTDVSEDDGLFLSEGTYVDFEIKESYIRNQLLLTVLEDNSGAIQGFFSLEIKIKTTKKESVLIFIQSNSIQLKLQVSSRNLE